MNSSDQNMVRETCSVIFDFVFMYYHCSIKFGIFVFFLVDMSFFRGIIDSFSSIFTVESNHDRSVSSSSSSASSMNVIDGAPVSNERVAYKLKGYFDLAKEEIAKGVRAEEWGLHDDALLHYRNAQRIMSEATSTPSPSYISSK